MNARHAHDLMRVKFPTFVSVEHDWHVLVNGSNADVRHIEAFLKKTFPESEVVVHISRKLGGVLPVHEAAALIAQNVCTTEIRLANRSFTRFAVIGQPGVVTTWRAD